MEVLGQFGRFWARFWDFGLVYGLSQGLGRKVGSVAFELFPPIEIHRLGVKMGCLQVTSNCHSVHAYRKSEMTNRKLELLADSCQNHTTASLGNPKNQKSAKAPSLQNSFVKKHTIFF